MTGLRSIAAFVLLGCLAGCVEPTVGPSTAAKRADGPAFQVRSVDPADAPRATRAAGSVDLFSGGAVAFVEGWAPGPDDTLLVVSKPPTAVINENRLLRPDAAAAVGLPGRPDLGFRLTLRGLGGSVDKVCVLARDPAGGVSVLGGSDASWCPAP